MLGVLLHGGDFFVTLRLSAQRAMLLTLPRPVRVPAPSSLPRQGLFLFVLCAHALLRFFENQWLILVHACCSRARFASRRVWNIANTLGTKNNVATVANNSPPITARPSGAFCSPPSPKPSAIGTMPMIMANAVISTGRTRV